MPALSWSPILEQGAGLQKQGPDIAAHWLMGMTFLPLLDAIAINHLQMKASLVHYQFPEPSSLPKCFIKLLDF